LQRQLKDTNLSATEKQAVIIQSVNLGNAKTPANTDVSDKNRIEKAYHMSFIDAYAIIMRLSAVLAFSGALMSVIFIKNIDIKKGNNTYN